MSEVMGGLTYLESIRELASRVDKDWPGVQVKCAAACVRILFASLDLTRVLMHHMV
jgi:hypothetical protein